MIGCVSIDALIGGIVFVSLLVFSVAALAIGKRRGDW